MTTDTNTDMERIYNRHTAALRMFASAGAISLQAVMLDLALALQELAETQGAMQQRRITELERNLEQLQLDIDAEVNGYRSQLAEANAAISNLQSQLTQLDADNASLICRRNQYILETTQ
mgnify:CR=1 FL=1|jgi:chromosome segregation ATPase